MPEVIGTIRFASRGTPTDETLDIVETKWDGSDLLAKTKDGRFLRFVNAKPVDFKITQGPSS